MTTEDFKNRVDGTLNDFINGVIDDTQFRTSILDTLIEVATPHLERKPKPFVPTTWTMGIDSTSSGAWFVITEDCIDPSTKEEWKDEIARTGTALVFDYEKYGNGIAATYENGPQYWKKTEHYDERLANARLIATAPDLLEVLKDFLNDYVETVNSGDCGKWDPEQDSKVIRARAIIKKATE